MPANFDDTLIIDSEGHLAPRGLIEVLDSEVNTELYIWVTQADPNGNGAFMTCEAGPSVDGTIWTMKPESQKHKGRFIPGVAIGWGTKTSELDGRTIVFTWMESLTIA